MSDDDKRDDSEWEFSVSLDETKKHKAKQSKFISNQKEKSQKLTLDLANKSKRISRSKIKDLDIEEEEEASWKQNNPKTKLVVVIIVVIVAAGFFLYKN